MEGGHLDSQCTGDHWLATEGKATSEPLKRAAEGTWAAMGISGQADVLGKVWKYRGNWGQMGSTGGNWATGGTGGSGLHYPPVKSAV